MALSPQMWFSSVMRTPRMPSAPSRSASACMRAMAISRAS